MENGYYLGLDIGTDSVGWAVTDENYKVKKFNGNAMWGVRLFDESNTAAERRGFRTSRRRLQRTRERLNLLESIFDKEISKVDISFFQRLKEGNLYREDKTVEGKYAVFSGDYTDEDFYKEYPTIYHLRSELINNGEPHDVRLVFLALHHIIKHRGHFLFEDMQLDDIEDFNSVYDDLINCLNEFLASDEDEGSVYCSDIEGFKNILKDRGLKKDEKKRQMADLFGITSKEAPQLYACLSLLGGSTVKTSAIFADESLDGAEDGCNKISFDGNFSDKEDEYRELLGERYDLIERLKAVYDWATLADILKDEKYISNVRVGIYNQHKADLKQLKEYVKKYMPEKYGEIFRISKKNVNNYVAYSGHIKEKAKTGVLNQTCNRQDFCAYLKKQLGECRDESYKEMFQRIEDGEFMPKQKSAENGVVPMQVNRVELVAILDNAKNYLPFLKEKDENGITAYDKIISIFDYKLPYYVGPLNKNSGNSGREHWVVRGNEKIYPWNFEKVVNLDESAEKFITQLTSKCTYLPGEDVLPKNSITYSKFMALNELNNLRVNSEKIDVAVKQDIYNDLFLKYNKVTQSKLIKYLNNVKGIECDGDSISGIDGDFKANMKSYRDFKPYAKLSDADKEEIIKEITIFGENKKILKKRLKAAYKDKLTDEEIEKISKLRYTGWGNLSSKFLTEVEGGGTNIMGALWETNNNLQQLIYSEEYKFEETINEINSGRGNKSLRAAVEDLYVSPQIKRAVYQALLIVREVEKIEKQPAEKVFIEVARGPEEKKRTVSRKKKLEDLYKNCKNNSDEIYKQLEGCEEDRLRSDKLYLYFTQMGRCIYTGEPIDLEELMGSNGKWDIDHIYPQSKIKDDSLDNRVLSKKDFNNNTKRNIYPLSADVRSKMASYWKYLLDIGLISKKKYERLVRNTPLTDEELSSFVNRQIVETRQSTKAVAGILKQMYTDKTEVVYVKAGLVSDFRNQFKENKKTHEPNCTIKCREINDLHHAKDAYLNIVVGNVYNVKFTHNKANFIEGLKSGEYSLNKMFAYDVNGAWDAENSLPSVLKTLSKNNILFTRYSYKQHGGLFDQNIVKKGNGQVPIKAEGARSDIQKYGGYNKASSAHFSLVKYTEKGQPITAVLPVDLYRIKEFEKDPAAYFTEYLKENSGKAFDKISDIEVIIPCIKYDSLLSFDGFRMHLSGKSGGGKQILFKPAVQLVVGYKYEVLVKNISKYLERTMRNDRDVDAKFDGINENDVDEFYGILIQKLTSTIYSVRYEKMGNELYEKTDKFKALSLRDKCKVISEIVKILHTNAQKGDLKLLGSTKSGAGECTISYKISSGFKSVKLINQSVTGLFEKQTELL